MTTSTFKNNAIATVAAFSLAGFVAAASATPAEAGNKGWKILGGAIVAGVVLHHLANNHKNNHNSGYSQWDAHVDWCYDNRPRYRESDNTFRYTGQVRHECFSPYSG